MSDVLCTCDICYEKHPVEKMHRCQFQILRCDPTDRLLCDQCYKTIKEHGVREGIKIILK